MPRIPVEQHAARVARLLAPLRDRGVETVPLADALGRVTAEAVASPIDLPPFRNSQMDGVAVRAADVAGASDEAPVELPVAGESAARPGEPPALPPGAAIRIMTGAPVPAGADAVVPVEDTDADGDRVLVRRPRGVGEYVREPGSDLAAGGELLPASVRIGSRHIGALAAAGLESVAVHARVRVAVVSTGSELAAPGEDLAPGLIPDANGPALAAAVRATGAEVVRVGRVRDDARELAALLDEAIAAGAELVITSGGNDMKDALPAVATGLDGPILAQVSANIDTALSELLSPGRFGPGVEVHVFEGNVYDASDGAGNYSQGGCNFADGLPAIPTDVMFDRWNDAIATAVEARGQTAVDMHGYFYGHGYNNPPNWYASDCTHPNSQGHDELQRLFFEHITGEALP